MKKVLSMLLIAMLVCTSVFANGGSETTTAVNPDGTVTIELWYGAAITEAGPIPDDWVGYQILRDEHGIDLHLSVLPSNESDQDVRIQAAAAGNSLPDIFMVSRPVLTRLVDQGLVAEVDDYYALMPNRTAQQYDADSKAMTTIDGHSYGFASPGSVAKNEGLLIRKDWLDNLGLEVPTNLDELMEVMKAFTYDDPDGNGRDDTYGYGAYIESDATLKGYPGARLFPILGAFGVDGLWCLEEENLGLNVYKPEFYDAMVYIRQMCEEGVMDPNWLTYKKDDFRAAWKQGRFGIMKEQNAAYAAESNYAPFDANFPDGEWIIIDPPEGPDGLASVGAYDQNYRIYAISQDAVDEGKAEKICELLEWMSSDEGYYDNSFSGPDGQVYTQLRNMVFYNSDIELASRYPTYTTAVSGKTMSALTALREMQSKYWTAAIGSGQMPTPNADVQRFYEQTLAEFLSGQRALTPENWQAFLDGFNSIGGKAWNDEGVAYAQANGLVR